MSERLDSGFGGHEPTIQLFEGGAKHKVTDLPGWHLHPECVEENGKPLSHLHGLSKQPPHTHLPVQSWGPAVPSERKFSEPLARPGSTG